MKKKIEKTNTKYVGKNIIISPQPTLCCFNVKPSFLIIGRVLRSCLAFGEALNCKMQINKKKIAQVQFATAGCKWLVHYKNREKNYMKVEISLLIRGRQLVEFFFCSYNSSRSCTSGFNVSF